MNLQQLRRNYHKSICLKVLGLRNGIPNIADKASKRSIEIATSILDQINFSPCANPPTDQKAGALFEELTLDYLEKAFALLQHLRPGKWHFSVHNKLTDFDQYEHLAHLTEILKEHPTLRATLGNYLIKPDIVIGRRPVSDAEVDQQGKILHADIARLTPLRDSNNTQLLLHASISCKWTIRSDRSQNARTESLNLIRNRKGNTPHIAIVTAEPLPNRIASLALGTGDLDCVYHMALNELQQAVVAANEETLTDMLNLLVEGKRLRDISDLPFDLAI